MRELFVLRPDCLFCGGPADTGLALCAGCDADLPWLGSHCNTCALPLPEHGLTCGECLRRPPPFEQVLAPWRYAFPLDGAITRFKHQADRPLGRLLGQLLGRHLRHAFAEGLPVPDLLLPVPLAPRRQRQRGFNQAELLARRLAADLGLPWRQPLRRVRDTPAQQGLDKAERKRNLRQAFALDDGAALRGLHLALVDDVLTTGATAAALAQLLRRAGAARVDVYCLARTPKPG
ncbi:MULTISPECIES: ComF family protein [unclassified Pseudomonas]|uniref:ComF family protein n=1 Tax=unclassified Pseudomonas TaxID=196821 RepID=UPI0005BD97EE